MHVLDLQTPAQDVAFSLQTETNGFVIPLGSKTRSAVAGGRRHKIVLEYTDTALSDQHLEKKIL